MSTKSQLPLILATAFLDILGMSLFIPLLPSIISDFWVHAAWSGYSQAIYAVGMFLGGLIFGRLSDTHGRKNILFVTSLFNLVSYVILLASVWSLTHRIGANPANTATLSGFSAMLSGITPLFLLYLFSRFVNGFGGSGFGVIQAYISDISAPKDRAKNMGMMGASFGFAFLIGPAMSGILSTWISLHTIVFITFLIVLLNVFLIYLFLTEPKKHIHTEEIHLKDFHFSRTVTIIFILSFGSTLAFSAIQAMSAQFYADRFSFTPAQIGYTMALVGLISIIYQGGLIRYIRVFFDEYKMLILSYLILVVGFLGFSLNTSPIWLFFWVALFPIGMGTMNPSIGAILAKNAGKEVGKVMGYNTSIQSIGNILWPIGAAVLYFTPGSNLPFLVSTGIFFALLFLSFSLRKNP